MTTMALPDHATFEAVFETEASIDYPTIDAFEAQHGFALDRDRLLAAARVLACPVKAHAPNWQHGRVLYALTREHLLAGPMTEVVLLLDIGTAKGFSALVLQWALMDSGRRGLVQSVDVIDPCARVRRNTVAEVDGFRTLEETLVRWPEASHISFNYGTGRTLLASQRSRVHVAFVDGKHSREEVAAELKLLSTRQQSNDLVICDDLQIPGVAHAVEHAAAYQFEYLPVNAHRHYAIGRRR